MGKVEIVQARCLEILHQVPVELQHKNQADLTAEDYQQLLPVYQKLRDYLSAQYGECEDHGDLDFESIQTWSYVKSMLDREEKVIEFVKSKIAITNLEEVEQTNV
jgi:hypothetical protein